MAQTGLAPVAGHGIHLSSVPYRTVRTVQSVSLYLTVCSVFAEYRSINLQTSCRRAGRDLDVNLIYSVVCTRHPSQS